MDLNIAPDPEQFLKMLGIHTTVEKRHPALVSPGIHCFCSCISRVPLLSSFVQFLVYNHVVTGAVHFCTELLSLCCTHI